SDASLGLIPPISLKTSVSRPSSKIRSQKNPSGISTANLARSRSRGSSPGLSLLEESHLSTFAFSFKASEMDIPRLKPCNFVGIRPELYVCAPSKAWESTTCDEICKPEKMKTRSDQCSILDSQFSSDGN